MRKNMVIICSASAFILLLVSCSSGRAAPEENMQNIIKNMQHNSYDFSGELHAQVGKDLVENLLVLEGSYVVNKGYQLHANVDLPKFESESDILKLNEKLYFKLPNSAKWNPATDQDLRMLGFTYKDCPADMFQGMKDMALLVEKTGKDNVFRVTLDKEAYTEKTDKEGIMHLPQVDIQSHDLQVKLLEDPVADVEVDLNRRLIRSVTLYYVMKSLDDGALTQPINVTYEMRMDHFNEGQTLPDL